MMMDAMNFQRFEFWVGIVSLIAGLLSIFFHIRVLAGEYYGGKLKLA